MCVCVDAPHLTSWATFCFLSFSVSLSLSLSLSLCVCVCVCVCVCTCVYTCVCLCTGLGRLGLRRRLSGEKLRHDAQTGKALRATTPARIIPLVWAVGTIGMSSSGDDRPHDLLCVRMRARANCHTAGVVFHSPCSLLFSPLALLPTAVLGAYVCACVCVCVCACVCVRTFFSNIGKKNLSCPVASSLVRHTIGRHLNGNRRQLEGNPSRLEGNRKRLAGNQRQPEYRSPFSTTSGCRPQ